MATTNAYTDPVNEVMFDLTWIYVSWHDTLHSDVQEMLMDYFGGSRGVFEKLHEEAKEFIENTKGVRWGEDADSNYFEAVDYWGTKMIKHLMALMARARVEGGVKP